MNTKKRDFLISSIIIVAFSIIVVLVINFFLISTFGFDQNTFYPITVLLVVVGSSVYYFLNRSILDEFFKGEEKLRGVLKETLHELNTPVATIQLNSKMLEKKLEDEKSIQRLERIKTACEDLLHLYEQMEYGIKEHIHHIENEEFELRDIVEKSINKFNDIKGDIRITYDGNSCILFTDKNGFEKSIDNLISNGIKYNKPKGVITITFKENSLEVRDTGVGIDTENLFHIFDRYYQENSLSSGVGLGLNIVKKYCDDNKVDIKIDSQKDEGTTFILDLKEVIQKNGS